MKFNVHSSDVKEVIVLKSGGEETDVRKKSGGEGTDGTDAHHEDNRHTSSCG